MVPFRHELCGAGAVISRAVCFLILPRALY